MFLKDAPIRRKLMSVNLLTSGAVILLSCAAFILYEVLTLHQTMLSGYSTRAEIIASNSAGSLAFSNEADATEVLAALKTDPRILEACLYNDKGEVFAVYPAGTPSGLFPPRTGTSGYHNGYLEIFCPVLQEGHPFGTVYLRSDLSALTDRYRAYAGLAASIIAASILLAYFLSRMLQNQISAPILALAETAKAVSKNRDFSVRAEKFGEDELGSLTDAFNGMLGEILEQDRALKASEANYREIFDKANDAIYIHDAATGRVLDVNQKTCDLFGFTREEFLNSPPEIFMTGNPGYTAQDAMLWLQKAAKEGPQLFEWQGRNKDGSFRWLEISIKRTVIAGKPRLLALVRDIGDRKKAQESELRLSTVVQNVPLILCTIDTKGMITLSTGKGLEKVGLQPGGSQGRSIYETYRNNPSVLDKVQMALAGEEARGLIDVNGFIMEALYKPIKDAKGKVTEVVGVAIDVTARQKAEEALKISETNYREIFAKANDGILITDPEGGANSIVDMNPRLEKMTGFTLEEYRDAPDEKLYSKEPGFTSTDYALLARKALAEGPQLFEWLARHKDGHTYWIGVNLQKAVIAGNTRLVAFIRDISERKQLEEVTRDQNFVTSVLENVPNMIFVKDAKDLRFVMFNKAGEELLGVAKGDIIGKSDYDLFPREEADFFTAKDQRTLAEGKLLDIPEEILSTKPFGERLLHTKKIPVMGPDGKPRYLLGISEDITDQRRQEEMEMYTKALEVSNREMQDFVFVASHDLQEPLRKIQSFGQFLRDEFKDVLGETGGDYVDRMQNAAKRMQILINDLLALTRVTTKAQPFSPVDLSRVIQEVLVDLESRIAEKNGKVEVAAMPTLQADPTQMRQLFQNLIGNALKFHKPGEAPSVKVTASRIEGKVPRWRIRVEDAGIGFDAQYADQIFKVFERLHGRDEYEGTGIGLAICRKVVERHGGKISAEGAPGKGSVFTVELPAAQEKMKGDSNG